MSYTETWDWDEDKMSPEEEREFFSKVKTVNAGSEQDLIDLHIQEAKDREEIYHN